MNKRTVTTLLLMIILLHSTISGASQSQSSYYTIEKTALLSHRDRSTEIITIEAGTKLTIDNSRSSDTHLAVQVGNHSGLILKEKTFLPNSSFYVLKSSNLQRLSDSLYLKPMFTFVDSSGNRKAVIDGDTLEFRRKVSVTGFGKISNSNVGRRQRIPFHLQAEQSQKRYKALPYSEDAFSNSLHDAMASTILLKDLPYVRQKRYTNQVRWFQSRRKNPRAYSVELLKKGTHFPPTPYTGVSFGDSLLWLGEKFIHHNTQNSPFATSGIKTLYKVYPQRGAKFWKRHTHIPTYGIWISADLLFTSIGEGLYRVREKDFNYHVYILAEKGNSLLVLQEYQKEVLIHKDALLPLSSSQEIIKKLLHSCTFDSTFTYEKARAFFDTTNDSNSALNHIRTELLYPEGMSDLKTFYAPQNVRHRKEYAYTLEKLESKGNEENIANYWPNYFTPTAGDMSHTIHHKEFLDHFFPLSTKLPHQPVTTVFTYLSKGVPIFKQSGKNQPYNSFSPEAIRWIHENLIPHDIYEEFNEDGDTYMTLYQDRYAGFIRELALDYQLLFADKACPQKSTTTSIVALFDHYVVSQEVSAEEFFTLFLRKEQVLGLNKEAYHHNQYLAFWCRRALDGSANEIGALLTTLLKRFDREWYERNIQISLETVSPATPQTELAPDKKMSFTDFSKMKDPFGRAAIYRNSCAPSQTKSKLAIIEKHIEPGLGTYALIEEKETPHFVRLRSGRITHRYTPQLTGTIPDMESLRFSPKKRWLFFRTGSGALHVLRAKDLIEKQFRRNLIQKSGDLDYLSFHRNDSLLQLTGGCLCEGEEGRTSYFEHLYSGINYFFSWSKTGEIFYNEEMGTIYAEHRPKPDEPIDTVRIISGNTLEPLAQWQVTREGKSVLDVKDVDFGGFIAAYATDSTIEVWKKGYQKDSLIHKRKRPDGLVSSWCHFVGSDSLKIVSMEFDEQTLRIR